MRKSRRAWLLLAVLIAVLAVGALEFQWKSYDAWEADDRPAPLIGNTTGSSIRRSYVLTNPFDPSNGATRWQLAWADSKGRRYEALEIAHEVSRILQRTDISKQWPGTQGTINGVQQRLAPFLITLVSLEPTVVLLQPHDYGGFIDRSNVAIVGEASPDKLYLSGFLNWLYVGTRLTPTDEVWCLAPDLNQQLRRLMLSAASTQIPGTRITITRTADALQIEPSP